MNFPVAVVSVVHLLNSVLIGLNVTVQDAVWVPAYSLMMLLQLSYVTCLSHLAGLALVR